MAFQDTHPWHGAGLENSGNPYHGMDYRGWAQASISTAQRTPYLLLGRLTGQLTATVTSSDTHPPYDMGLISSDHPYCRREHKGVRRAGLHPSNVRLAWQARFSKRMYLIRLLDDALSVVVGCPLNDAQMRGM